MNEPLNDPWSIQLFGGLRIRQAERLITRFRTQKTGALLAFLSYHRQHSQPRDVLIEMFWPDTAPESGRHNLSHALSSLRHQLEPPGVPAGSVLVADRFSVELNPEAFTTDVADFERALRTATQARNTPEQMPLLTQALDNYTGPLLPDYYEEWIASEQERLAQRFQQGAAQLMALREKAGDGAGALEIAQRAVSLDPLREEANRELMRLLIATGQIEAALRQYHAFARLLDRELAEAPGSALRQLLVQIEALSAQRRPPLDLRAVAAAADSPPTAPVPIALPTGTVTFLTTDIEGSAALWEKAGDAFRSALSRYHALLRREFRRQGGHEVKEAGDSFLVVFASVGDALAGAIAAQRSLDTQPGPEEIGALPVRMALHTGDVEWDAGEYHGLLLHQTARMLAAAHGGQILCSEATAGLLKRNLDAQVQLKDLGVWRLQDAEEPERLFQALYPEMANAEFPPLHAFPARRAHLPLQFTRFFGRKAEIARIVEMLASPETRLLTLTGPGGTGKTRLCIEAAGRFSATFAGAIWFVPLADLSDPGLIPQTILHAMSLALTGGQEPLEQLVTALTNQSTLLLLDNFEHLVAGGGAEVVQTLLSRVPTLQCLVTSRQTLNLPGEVEFAVPPLPTPGGSDTPERLSAFESVRLFVDRAQAAKPDFRITNSNAPAVAELCARLEGIPLAIELAAARALVLTPAQMLVQLGNRFEFLVSRKRGVAERQRTLRAAVDWSYRLLAPDIQRFFAQLCVFRGGWTVEAAEAACDETLALDLLAQLRECSLVTIQESASGIRFRMLETLREYAQTHLSAAEQAALRQRHAAFFLALAEEAEPQLTGPEQAAWFNHLEVEHDNVRAALTWFSTAEERVQTALRLSGALWRFWTVRGHFREGRARYAAVLGTKGATERTRGRAKALLGAGGLALDQNDDPAARALIEESLSIYRELGDRQGIADSLHSLGNYEESLTLCREVGDRQGIARALIELGREAQNQCDYATARSLYAEGLAIFREVGNLRGIASFLHCLGSVASTQGDYAAARSLYAEGLAIRREIEDIRGIAGCLYSMGNVASDQGDYAAARSFYEESLAIKRELGAKQGIAYSLLNLGDVAYAQGDTDSARSCLEESLANFRNLGDTEGIAYSLRSLGHLDHQHGDFASAHSLFAESLTIRQELKNLRGIAESLELLAALAQSQQQTWRSTQLYSTADHLRQTLGAPLPPMALREYNARLASLRESLEAEAFAAAWEAGRAMTWEQAVAYALEEGAPQ